MRLSFAKALLVLVAVPQVSEGEPPGTTFAAPVAVVSSLPCPKTPIDVEVDFGALMRRAGAQGVLDPNSIEVANLGSGRLEPHALSQHFAYGDRGRVRWVIENPEHKQFEIRFATAKTRSVLLPRPSVPMIGVGDLLQYNAGAPAPVGFFCVTGLADLTGDGVGDLVGCDCYTTEPMWPEERIPASWRPFFCYPRVGGDEQFHFTRPVRLRCRMSSDGPDQFFTAGYMYAETVDLNGDGLLDCVYTAAAKSSEPSSIRDVDKYIHLYLNSGKRDAGGMPIFVAAGRIPHPEGWWGPARAVDLNQDGAVDFVVGRLFSETDSTAYYLENANPKGWPIRPSKPVQFDPGKRAAFYDVDGDGRLDSLCLVHDERAYRRTFCDRAAWRKNLGGAPPRFAPPETLEDIDQPFCDLVAAVNDGPRRGVLVSSDFGQHTAFYEQAPSRGGRPRFQRHWARSVSAPIRLGDQATPCPCDWDGDGDWDLLAGGGHGRVRIVLNQGADQSALFVQYRDAHGKLRLRKDRIITLPDGKPMKNVLYQPAQIIPIDWDGDGLLDLVINHGQTMDSAPAVVRNIGAKTDPRFDFPRRLACFGEEMSGIAKHGPYYGAGDMDGDGKPDLIAGVEMGLYLFFRRTAMDLDAPPQTVLGPARILRAEDASGAF